MYFLLDPLNYSYIAASIEINILPAIRNERFLCWFALVCVLRRSVRCCEAYRELTRLSLHDIF